MIALVAYGLFATLYWPVTAVSPDVWGSGYAQLPAANTTATLVGTGIWLVLAVILTVTSLRMRRPPLLVAFGLVAIALIMPTTLAAVGIYNVIPTATPYPDTLTPSVLRVGLIAIVVGLILAWWSWRKSRREAKNESS